MTPAWFSALSRSGKRKIDAWLLEVKAEAYVDIFNQLNMAVDAVLEVVTDLYLPSCLEE